MNINVSWANRIYDETYCYAKARVVRHTSQISALNFILQVKVSGVDEMDARDTLDSMGEAIGCHTASELIADTTAGNYTKCFYVAKDLGGEDLRLQKELLMKKARKVAWDLKCKRRGLVPSAPILEMAAV